MADTLIFVRTVNTVEETKQVAAALAMYLRAGNVVVLNGGLGAGKTHFVQGVAEALGIAQPVTSPTFNILQTYPVLNGDGVSTGQNVGRGISLRVDQAAEEQVTAGSGTQEKAAIAAINHFDLYRLESAEELDDIGFFETLEDTSASFIEWGDKFPESMPDDYLEITITADNVGTRTIQATSHGPRSEALLSAWAENASS